MRNISDKFVEKIRTHLVSSKMFPINRTVYEKMLGNTSGRGRPQMTTRHMRIACWLTKAINTHSQYVKLACPPQKCLHECAQLLRYKYVAYFVHCCLTRATVRINHCFQICIKYQMNAASKYSETKKIDVMYTVQCTMYESYSESKYRFAVKKIE